jgi:hypothetical protein
MRVNKYHDFGDGCKDFWLTSETSLVAACFQFPCNTAFLVSLYVCQRRHITALITGHNICGGKDSLV